MRLTTASAPAGVATAAYDDASSDGDGGAGGWIRRAGRRAHARLDERLAPASRRKLATAQRHFARFTRRLRGRRVPFRTPRAAGDLKALLHNEWTLVLFTEYLAEQRARRSGRRLAVDTVAEYVGMLKQELSVRWGFAVAGDPQRLPAVVKALRRERPRRNRRQRRGIRRAHLRAAWRACGRLRSDAANAVNDWAAATSAWQAVARGGEVATPRADVRGWRASTRPTRADLSFGETRGRRYAQLMLRPIKRRNGEVGEKVPILFEEGDGGGDDTYAALRRLVRLDPCEPARTAETPLFRTDGRPMTTERLRRTARRIFRACGQRGKVGAHSFRIGGGTDLADQGASKALLAAKGRWASDIAQIYARMTRRAQLAASRAMQSRGGRDMEELFPHFTQGR
jgi:hypothetical protein